MLNYETTGVSTDGTNTSYSYTYNNYCEHRLPCGYCKELGERCPLLGSKPIVSWTTESIPLHHGAYTTGTTTAEAKGMKENL